MPKDPKLFGLPVNQEIAFSNHINVYKRRIEKIQTKFLRKLSSLKPFLGENEKILLITPARSPMTGLERLIIGWMVYYLKRCVLVFTNKRIIHLPAKPDYSYRNSIAQILYSDCQKISTKWKSLICNYKNGEKEIFHGLTGVKIKKVQSLLSTFDLGGPQSKYKTRTHLCPCCAAQLEKGKYICPDCRLIFKNKKESQKISWIYPGGGYFYTRHPFLGFGNTVAELTLIALVVTTFINLWAKVKGSGIMLILFGLLLVYEKLMTVYETNHFIDEYIPVDKEIRVRIKH